MASVLAQWRAGPFARPGTRPVNDAVLDAVAARHGPDLPFALGTSVHRLLAALRAHGLDAECVHGPGAEPALRAQLSLGRWTPVLLDDGRLGGPPFGAHWAVATRIEEAGLRLGNARREWLDWPSFRQAWACGFLPPPHRRCAVLVHGRTAEERA